MSSFLRASSTPVIILLVLAAAGWTPAPSSPRVEGFSAHVAWQVDSLGRFVLLIDRPGSRDGTVDLAVFYVPRKKLPGTWKADYPDAHVELAWSNSALTSATVVDRVSGRRVLEIGPVRGAGARPPVEGPVDGKIILRGGKALALYTGQALRDDSDGPPGPLAGFLEAVRSLVGKGTTSEDLLPTFDEAKPERVRILEAQKQGS